MSLGQQFKLSALSALPLSKRTLSVRFSVPEDVPAVLEFYNTNQHHNVDHRGDSVFKDRTEKGRTLLVLNPDRTIGMSSMSHPFEKSASVEIGSTRSRLDGFGLYPFIIASQIIHEFIERPANGPFFACIHKDNVAVTTLLNKKVGWNMITPTQEFADSIGEGDNINTLFWLHADTDTFSHQAKIVLDVIAEGRVKNKKTGESLALDLSSFSLANEHHQLVKELANGDFGKMLQKLMPQSPKTAREALARHMGGTLYLPEFLTINP